jgi:hypothetical protein
MPEKIYLDDSGNPIASSKVYLDERGEPIQSKSNGSKTAEAKRGSYSPTRTIGENFQKFKAATFGNPVGMLATLGAIAGTVPSGGTSLASLPLVALGAAGGAGMGVATDAVRKGPSPSMRDDVDTMIKEGMLAAAMQGTLAAAGPVLRGSARVAAKAPTMALDAAGAIGVPGAKTVARILRMMPKAPTVTPNAGGRVVRPEGGNSIETAITDALQETRAPMKPNAVTLPPPPTLPPGYRPRTTVPARTGGQATARASAPVPTPAAPVSRPLRLATRPAPTPAEIPASWRPFAEGAAPTPKSAPLGLSDDAPMWGRSADAGNTAREMRGALGAEDAGALMEMSADEVRALSGAPKRRPLVADLADLDLGFARKLADPKASVLMPLLGGAGAALTLKDALLAALQGETR